MRREAVTNILGLSANFNSAEMSTANQWAPKKQASRAQENADCNLCFL